MEPGRLWHGTTSLDNVLHIMTSGLTLTGVNRYNVWKQIPHQINSHIKKYKKRHNEKYSDLTKVKTPIYSLEKKSNSLKSQRWECYLCDIWKYSVTSLSVFISQTGLGTLTIHLGPCILLLAYIHPSTHAHIHTSLPSHRGHSTQFFMIVIILYCNFIAFSKVLQLLMSW